jgi:flagellar secretion chaperone FliS
MSSNYYQAYKKASVQTSPAKLLLMLYDGLIQSIHLGHTAIQEKRIEDVNRQLVKAENIVRELQTSLKMEYEISSSLTQLYDYFYRRLVEANIHKDVSALDEILPMIEDLRESWYQASIKIATGAS